MSDPLADVRDTEDCREHYLAGYTTRDQARLPRAPRAADDVDLPLVGGRDCWCGRQMGHDWPGKSDGAPHPRERR